MYKQLVETHYKKIDIFKNKFSPNMLPKHKGFLPSFKNSEKAPLPFALLAEWAGWLAGWLGWLAGLPGLACWAGWACLGLVLSTSGTKARISSNRASWVWFSRFLEPTPGSV